MVYLLRPGHWTSAANIRANRSVPRAPHPEHHGHAVREPGPDPALPRRRARQRRRRAGGGASRWGAQTVGAAGEDRGRDPGVCRQGKGLWQRKAREDAWKGEAWDEAEDDPFEKPAAWRPAFAVLGPAGSGKSTAVHDRGARVLLTAPTGRLAATLRERFPGLEPVHEALEVMWPHDLIVVEEVGQLSRELFERLITQWRAAERIPTLVFVGDFYQLPGVEPTTALDSPQWHHVQVQKRHLHEMIRCKCPILRKKLEPP